VIRASRTYKRVSDKPAIGTTIRIAKLGRSSRARLSEALINKLIVSRVQQPRYRASTLTSPVTSPLGEEKRRKKKEGKKERKNVRSARRAITVKPALNVPHASGYRAS